MFHFLETDIREQKSMKREYRHLWINTVNDLHYEIKFENHMKDKINFYISRTFIFFFKQKYILFLGDIFFQIPKNLIASAFYLPRLILKNIDMPRHLLIAKMNFKCWFVVKTYLALEQTI